MRTATLFNDNGRQAVRLPKGMRFEGGGQVEVAWQGESIILTPKADPKTDNTRLAARPGDGEQSLADTLAMTAAAEVDFDPPTLQGPLYRPAEFPDASD